MSYTDIDTQGLPGPRCGAYVDAGMVSWPCRLPLDHKGPHVAEESPRSKAERQRWLEAQAASAAPLPPPPFSIAGGSYPALNPAALNDPVERQQAQLNALRGDLGTFPAWAQSAMLASSAQVSLALLWSLANHEFDQGAQAVTISREFLERLVTPAVRDFLSNFTL